VSDAFNGEAADFSGMTDEVLYIDDVIQRAKLTIDENGVEGAAATDIIYLGAMPDEFVNFTADRPFSFFVIADAETERYVLFEGKIVE
ncbi:MAG: serpin family protein, partial [Clostridia bacterium]|nr:serpin family protein [Clostridia bacterium]